MEGLRREEVAILAGVSVDYYTRLERGNLAGASEAVLVALARALQLDEAEQAHPATRRRAGPNRVRPSVQRVLDALAAPAWIRNDRADVVAANALGRAPYAPLYDDPIRPANTARFTFLSPQARDFYTAEPDSSTAQALDLLASRATTQHVVAERDPSD